MTTAEKKEPSEGVSIIPMSTVADLYRYSTGFEKFLLALSVLHAIANGALMPLMAWVMGDLIDIMASPDPDFTPLIIRFIIFMVVAMYTSFVFSLFFELVSERQAMRLKSSFFLQVARQEIGWFDTSDPGELNSKISEDVLCYREGCGAKVPQFIQNIAMFLGGFIIGFIRGWKMTLVVLSITPLLGASGKVMMDVIKKGQTNSSEAFAEAGSVAEESFSNIRTVQSLGAQNTMYNKFISKLDAAYRSTVQMSLKTGLSLGTMLFLMFGMFALGFWYGGQLLADDMDAALIYPLGCADPQADCFTPGNILTVFFSVMMSAMTLGQIPQPLQNITKARVSLFRIQETLLRKPKIDSLSEEGMRLPNVEGNITFKDVTFAFPSRPERPVYKSLSFTIPRGKTVALVGASGCGKSSAVQLLMRYYDSASGEILIDGHNITSLNVQWMRSHIGIVTQEPRLFATSIMENIRNGKAGATDEECIEAAKMANAHNFITTFPDGYNTNVGDGGSQLSGGQKQRIAIARALIRDPEILILDEATSALDNESEKIVQEALDHLLQMKSRTTLVIAHRLTTIRNADKIVVLDNSNNEGSVVIEQGTHDELMVIEGGMYRCLVEGKQSVPAHGEKGGMDINELSRKNSSLTALHETYNSSNRDSILKKLSRESNLNDILSHIGSELAQSNPKPTSRKGSGLVMVEKTATGIDKTTKLEQIMEATEDSGKIVSKSKAPKPKINKRVFNMVKDEKGFIGLGLLCSMVKGATFPMFAFFMAEMLGALFRPTGDEVRSDCAMWAYYFIGFGILAFFANGAAFYSFGRAEAKLTLRMRRILFEALLKQDMTFFDNKNNSPGTLVSNLSSDAVLVKSIVSDSLNQMVSNTVSLGIGLGISFYTSWKLTLVMIATLVIIIPGSALEAKYVMMDQSSKDKRAQNDEDLKNVGSAGHILNETLSAIRIVHALGMERSLGDKFNIQVHKDYAKGKTRSLMFALAFMFSQGAQFATNVIAFAYGSELIKQGEINVAQMMRVVQAIMMAGMGLAHNAVFASDQAKGRDAAIRIFGVVDRKPEISLEGGKKDVAIAEQDIHLKNIEFYYPSRAEQKIYDGINFTIPKNKTTALVGASGCGKSTCVQLLERFYNSTDGDIMINGVEIKDLNTAFWRSNIGLVSQEPVLFQGTIADNIRMGYIGEGECDLSKIEDAAKMANAFNFIKTFPDGFDTQVGMKGGQLSGGQKQRIAIARALIRDPSLLILDEATSALDNESERIVQEALDKLLEMKSRTTLIIAHRLTTIKNADKIIVFDNSNNTGSKIIEEGSHDELMKIEGGTYRKLVEISEGARH